MKEYELPFNNAIPTNTRVELLKDRLAFNSEMIAHLMVRRQMLNAEVTRVTNNIVELSRENDRYGQEIATLTSPEAKIIPITKYKGGDD